MEHFRDIKETILLKKSSVEEIPSSYSLPADCVSIQAGEMLHCHKNKRGKPKSAGNAGFRKHNKQKFMKTERMRGLRKKSLL